VPSSLTKKPLNPKQDKPWTNQQAGQVVAIIDLIKRICRERERERGRGRERVVVLLSYHLISSILVIVPRLRVERESLYVAGGWRMRLILGHVKGKIVLFSFFSGYYFSRSDPPHPLLF
jgi:hypothetical protein